MSDFFVVGVTGVGWQFVPVVGWQFLLTRVVLVLGAGSHVPPAIFSLGFWKVTSLIGLAWLVGVTDRGLGWQFVLNRVGFFSSSVIWFGWLVKSVYWSFWVSLGKGDFG